MPASKRTHKGGKGALKRRVASGGPDEQRLRNARPAHQTPPGSQRRRRQAAPGEVFTRLHQQYPDAHCELDHTTPFQLLVATILSAQCTDKRVNLVTPALFQRYPTAETLANAEPAESEALIKTTGFYRSKAKNLIGMATGLVERFHSKVPKAIEELVTLPGVGRKTANVILGDAFGIAVGVVVDTHVGRLSRRLGWTKATDPVKVEQELMRLFPSSHWTLLAHLLIFHGRRVCYARRPQCEHCVLHDICPSSLV